MFFCKTSICSSEFSSWENLIPAHAKSQTGSLQNKADDILISLCRLKPRELIESACVGILVVNRPQADALVLWPSSQQSLPGVLVIREGHAERHVCVVVKDRQRLQLLPAEHSHSVVPARRCQQPPVASDAELRNARIDQRHTVLELQNHRDKGLQQTVCLDRMRNICIWSTYVCLKSTLTSSFFAETVWWE